MSAISSLTDGEEPLLLGDLRLDVLLLRRLLGDDLRLIGARLLEVLAPRLDLLAVPLDGLQDCVSWLDTRSIASRRAMMSSRLCEPRITSSVSRPHR